MASNSYVTETHNVYVIVHNSALLKCQIPSFVADFVSVDGWLDDQGGEFFQGSRDYGNQHCHFALCGCDACQVLSKLFKFT